MLIIQLAQVLSKFFFEEVVEFSRGTCTSFRILAPPGSLTRFGRSCIG